MLSLLMRKDDACWVLGHQEQMTEMGKHFCRLKFCGWKTTYFGAAEYDVERQAKHDRIHTHTHSQFYILAIFVWAFTLTSIYSDLHCLPYLTFVFQVFPLKIPKNGFPSSRNNTHTHTHAYTTRHSHKRSTQVSTNDNVQRSSTTPTETKLTHTLASWT